MIPRIARWTALSALFLIPFVVLWIDNSFFFPFITGKGFYFRILVDIALAGWVVLAIADKRYRPQFSWPMVFFTALTLWMVLADALAINPFKAFWSNFERMDGWVNLFHVYAFFLVSGSILSVDKLWRRWWFTFTGVVALVCAYSLLQLGGGIDIHQGGVRVDATLGNAAYLAAYLLFAFAITVWQAIESKGFLRYTMFALAAVEVWILFATETRGAILALVGASMLGAILWAVESGKRGRQVAGATLALLILATGGFFLMRHSAFVQNNSSLNRIAGISLSEGQPRFGIWTMALDGAMERPITGWGQEGFNYVFNKYYKPSLYTQEPWFDRAHDVFLDWLIAGGIPALLLFLALFGGAVWALYRGSASRAERVLLVSVLAAYAFQGLFVFDNLFSYVPLAAVLALAHAAGMRPIKKLQELPVPTGTTLQSTAAIGAVFGIALVWIVNVPGMRAASDLIHAITPAQDASTNLAYFKQAIADNSFANQEIREQLASIASSIVNTPSIPNDVKAQVAQYALAQMGEQIRETPKDARLRLEYAYAFQMVGDTKGAIAQLDAALLLSPQKQSIIIQKGLDEWQVGDLATASALFTQAYELDTSIREVAVYAAAGKIATGDTMGGETLLLNGYGTTVVDNNYLLLAYYQTRQFDKFLAIYQLRASHDGTADTHFKLALAYGLAGRITEARAEVAATLKIHPEAATEAQGVLTQINSGKY